MIEFEHDMRQEPHMMVFQSIEQALMVAKMRIRFEMCTYKPCDDKQE